MQTAARPASWEKQWGRIVARAWTDDKFRQRLVNDPATVLREQGIEVPYDVELQVVEDTPEICHLVLPTSPASDLSDEELTGTVGYDSYSGFSFSGGDCRRCGCGRCGCGCDRHQS